MNYREEKKIWAESLKVGDLVEDCRFRKLRIKEIHKTYSTMPKWGRSLLGAIPLWVPSKVEYFIEDYLIPKVKGPFIDSDLILEDDSHCSAMNCCDPVLNEEE